MSTPRCPPWSTANDSFGDFQCLRPDEYARGQVPWCLQPQKMQCHSDVDLDALEVWRREVAALVDRRIAAYEALQQPRSRSEPVVCSSSPAASRVASIAELVESVLQNADVVTLLIATGVCKKWRDIAGYIMERRGLLENFSHEPCVAPVNFHDLVSEDITQVPMPKEELEKMTIEFFDDVWSTTSRCKSGILRPNDVDKPDVISMIYLPGRFTQNPSATWDLLLGYHEQYLFQLRCYDIHVSHPRLHGWGNGWGRTRWMDLSQFDFNPQFLSLFANSILTASGVVEITLPPRILSADISGWHSLPNTAMEYLDSHLTHPPVVSLNISTWVPQLSESKPRPRKALHIFNIRNEKGIRILQLVSAMKNAYGLAIEHWLHWTKVLRTIVDEMHWDQDIWIIGNAPKLLISLDPYVSGGENLLSVYYLSCMYALRDRDERQAEWMPKPMFRHAASLPRISPLGGWAYP